MTSIIYTGDSENKLTLTLMLKGNCVHRILIKRMIAHIHPNIDKQTHPALTQQSIQSSQSTQDCDEMIRHQFMKVF